MITMMVTGMPMVGCSMHSQMRKRIRSESSSELLDPELDPLEKLSPPPTRAQALAQIESGLREDFDAYHTVLVLPVAKGAAGTPPGDAASHFLREVSTENPVFRSFESLFTSARPRCGQVRDSQRDFLFGAESAAIGSVALIPLIAMTPPGLLVLGSVDRDRFHPGMSVEFLSRMAELIADSLLRP